MYVNYRRSSDAVIGEVFGVSFRDEFRARIARDFTPLFEEQHPGHNFAGYILHPRMKPVPREPQLTADVFFWTTDDYDLTLGLVTNVDHKAQFALETGLDSSLACAEPHLVMPGDYPYDGFFRYRGVWVGGSGVMKELDVDWAKKAVDIYAEVRGGIVLEVSRIVNWVEANLDPDIGDWRYLAGDLNILEIWRQIYHEENVARSVPPVVE